MLSPSSSPRPSPVICTFDVLSAFSSLYTCIINLVTSNLISDIISSNIFDPSTLYCTTGSCCAYPLNPIPCFKSSMLSKCSIHLSSTTFNITILSNSSNSVPISFFFVSNISLACFNNSSLNSETLTTSLFNISSGSIANVLIISCLNTTLFPFFVSNSSLNVSNIISTVSDNIFLICVSMSLSPSNTILLCEYIISLCAFITSS